MEIHFLKAYQISSTTVSSFQDRNQRLIIIPTTLTQRATSRRNAIPSTALPSRRVKIGGGGCGGWTPTGKQITPTANAREKKLGGRVLTPLGPDSGECIHYDIDSFSLFKLKRFHNLFCTIFMFIFTVRCDA